MKIYVVFYPDSYDVIKGVFSSEEKAKAFIKENERRSMFWDWEEFTLDEPDL